MPQTSRSKARQSQARKSQAQRSQRTPGRQSSSSAQIIRRAPIDWNDRKDKMLLLHVFNQRDCPRPSWTELSRVMGNKQYSPTQLKNRFNHLQTAAKEQAADPAATGAPQEGPIITLLRPHPPLIFARIRATAETRWSRAERR
ncbi:hypothetical protein FE257_011269 [Aspergillus nanangensis]|uniref:Myb-like domain-containing protein n=1 Tax=Aspergillus nanangensis TaxID=2582783 RepID=A0AAD4CHL3_ASPNN|nr:hypothetical protein FE257_011269 [Aspergillus nanangensis]